MKTLTVAKLMELLQDQPPDALVITTANYGDRARTQQALPIRYVEATTIVTSAYSDSGYAIDEPDENDNEDGSYVVIR